MQTSLKTEFEAHLRAIEDAVTVANLDGGCDIHDTILYHTEKLRQVEEKMNVQAEVESNG